MSNIPTLPEELRPADGRFGSGPSKVRPEALQALAATGTSFMGTSHRRHGIRSVVGRLRTGLADLFSLPDGYEVVLGNGGTTGFWDAALFSLIERRSQHLAFGEFSAKFAAAVTGAPHLDEPHVIEAPPGTCPHLQASPDIDFYALTHNETSTGVMTAIRRPAADGLVAVDATSAAGGLPVDPAEFDVYYFAPQKAFAADGGLWAALMSPAAQERIGRIASSERWVPRFSDLSIALTNSRKDQTYNTPALATIFLFTDQVEWLLTRGGLPWAVERCRTSAGVVYGWAEQSAIAEPFVADDTLRSSTVATIDFVSEVSAERLATALRANGIIDIEGYRKLGRNQLRIAMFPAIEPADLKRLTKAIDWLAARV